MAKNEGSGPPDGIKTSCPTDVIMEPSQTERLEGQGHVMHIPLMNSHIIRNCIYL